MANKRKPGGPLLPFTDGLDLFKGCMLEGEELDRKVSELNGLVIGKELNVVAYSLQWCYGGPIIDRDHIYLDPPKVMHLNFGNGKGKWVETPMWTATVSAGKRTKPLRNGLFESTTVGRGCGPTALIAAMRAFVDSFEEKVIEPPTEDKDDEECPF